MDLQELTDELQALAEQIAVAEDQLRSAYARRRELVVAAVDDFGLTEYATAVLAEMSRPAVQNMLRRERRTQVDRSP